MQKPKTKIFPVSLAMAAGYLIIIGAVGVLRPLLNLSPVHPAWQTNSLAFRLVTYSREITINALFLVSGIGLFLRKSWARKLALTMLVIATFYFVFKFARDFLPGKSGVAVLVVSFAVVGAWNGFCWPPFAFGWQTGS
jgi:hypothetical protein